MTTPLARLACALDPAAARQELGDFTPQMGIGSMLGQSLQAGLFFDVFVMQPVLRTDDPWYPW
jgi:hypothetical protein